MMAGGKDDEKPSDSKYMIRAFKELAMARGLTCELEDEDLIDWLNSQDQ